MYSMMRVQHGYLFRVILPINILVAEEPVYRTPLSTLFESYSMYYSNKKTARMVFGKMVRDIIKRPFEHIRYKKAKIRYSGADMHALSAINCKMANFPRFSFYQS